MILPKNKVIYFKSHACLKFSLIIFNWDFNFVKIFLAAVPLSVNHLQNQPRYQQSQQYLINEQSKNLKIAEKLRRFHEPEPRK